MLTTIKEMMMKYTTVKSLTEAFSDLWLQAEEYGSFMEFEGDEIFATLYEDWYIESSMDKSGLVTFTDKTDAIITFHKAGTGKYTDITLEGWDFDPMACLREYMIEI